VFEKDIIGQAERMIGNIEALLDEAGCGLEDVQEAVVYLRDPADYQTVRNFFEKNHPDFPHIIVLAHVCRPGWLIETECMAIRAC
jgi:enamine deaminase RidA (YjgF/YER057c/UK114 family)